MAAYTPVPPGRGGGMEQGTKSPIEWVAIPGGRARIGAAPGVAAGETDVVPSAEQPATTVSLPTFSIGRTPVTNAAYARFIGATGHRAPAHWEGAQPPPARAQHPVTYVDRRDVLAYCAWAGVRLPTEAEWEKAARGTDGRRYPWGDRAPTPREANCHGWFGGTTEVGAFLAGASPYGVLELAGSVWEWTASLERPYPYVAGDGREEPHATGRRVLRGGSFNHAAADIRCAARAFLHGDACDEYIGFRVVVDEPDAPHASGDPTDWVRVPAGPFRMGSAVGDPSSSGSGSAAAPGLGRPQHEVVVVPFLLGRIPVINARYGEFVAATGARPPGHWEGPQPPRAILDHPVTYVDWHEAGAFCAWAGVRLPTEVEWELAAAGTDGRPFPWGDASPEASTAWFGRAGDDVATRPVGERPAGATPEGVLDMAGNVWEWTASLHRPYPYDPTDGREDDAAAGQRVLRGGSFRSPAAEYLRGAFRSRSHPTRRRDHIGFRVARDRRPHDP